MDKQKEKLLPDLSGTDHFIPGADLLCKVYLYTGQLSTFYRQRLIPAYPGYFLSRYLNIMGICAI